MDKFISVSADNNDQLQVRRKKVVRINSPVVIEQKIITSISNISMPDISDSGIDPNTVETPVESGIEFSRLDFLQALRKVSRPDQPQRGKETSEASE
jgi:hypothetical protein